MKIEWVDGYEIKSVAANGEIVISANREGLLSLAKHLTALADEDPELGIEGTQIDLLIQRADRITNILEMKYSHSEYTINKTLSRELRRKVSDFRMVTGTKDGIHVTLVTPYGLKWNEYAGEIQSQVTGEDLFHK